MKQLLALLLLLAPIWAPAQDKAPAYLLITNATLWDGTSDTATDTQGPLVSLPVITADQVTVEGNHTTTPTFSWQDISPGNYYRVWIFDGQWNTIYRTDRSDNTSVVIPPNTLPVGINYAARMEVHDSESFMTLDNRSNGEWLYLDTMCIDFGAVTHVNTPDGQKTYLHLDIKM